MEPVRASVVVQRPPARATTVTLTHRQFERHGEGAAGYRDAMASDRGWPRILERYAAAAAGG